MKKHAGQDVEMKEPSLGRRAPWLGGVALVLTLVALAVPPAAAEQGGNELVAAFVAAFNERDVDAVMAFFAEDAVYHNMPMQPIEGVVAIRAAIEGFVNPASEIAWEILHSAEVGHAVLTERVDHFVLGDKKVALPVMGIFEIEDGKITAWRDYFDLATWQRQAGG
jgi:limonene-1,2-epoxide hydrolase